ncbi:MAG: hypothetical protein EXS03_05205 [Phycisphaerales bacterium]|nr:hypothetical protein [Phycisphaerales bacterium]
MKSVVLGASLAAVVASAAVADVTYSFDHATWTGFNFSEAFAAGSLAGTLTGASINVTLDASVSWTYADDLTIYVAGTPLATGGALQCGGYSSLSAGQRYYWPNGGFSAPGTTSIGTVNFATGIDLTGSAMSVWVGNGYGAQGTSGTWTGSVTLHGVNAVPAPGAIALLGVAGLVSRRRRA